MKCVVATLFEHHYHFGAAALVNSLCRAGFSGTIYAGFRGPLPPWTGVGTRAARDHQWEMKVTPEVRIVFLALDTPAHFTNYKPDFLLQVEALDAGASEALIYCDPDLVYTGEWRYVEDWLRCGVALCEDVNSPFSQNHPHRVGWRRFYGPLGFKLEFRGTEYANGGFVGLRWEHRQLLVTWRDFIRHMATALGGPDVAGISGGRWRPDQYGFGDCFRNTDQDALNAGVEACPEIPVSFLGRQTMGFQAGRAFLPHALGDAKPWRRHYLREALSGLPPTAADKAFWRNVEGPLRPYSSGTLSFRRFKLAVASGLGRLIQRT
jgi:hypothetical protein